VTARKLGAVARRQRLCTSCGQVPAAMTGVAFCFGCWPGGPVTPPPCLRCGSASGYYTSGICRRCHPSADAGVDSCLDCYAWGATRTYGWLCRGCRTFRTQGHAAGPCPACGRTLHLGHWGVCRLCYKQASMMRPPEGALDPIGANRHGQQLFFAGMSVRSGLRRLPEPAPLPPLVPGRQCRGQLTLFTMRRDLTGHSRAGLHLLADPATTARLEPVLRDLASRHGWSARQAEDTSVGLRIVLGIQDTPGAPVKASDVTLLRGIDLPVWTVIEVLTAAGMLEEDRTPAFDTWFTQQISGLPEPMTGELRTWFEVMKHGSPAPPRRRPRTEVTIGLNLRWALPVLRAWAAAGHTSLREITRDQVLDALPASGNPRAQAGQGLKSIFRLLKGRQVLFTDPTARVKTGQHQSRQPLPADLAAIRAALNSPHQAQAAVTALVAFHGLRTEHLRRLLLTDLRDGRLHVDGRIILLAGPVRERLAAWLDHRNHRWPATANPHLFIHYRTEPVGRRWVKLAIGPGLTATSIREDRILNEAHATGGDQRRLADLFGLSISAATRYTTTVDHPSLTRQR
jgi:hypothetical protein